MRTIIHDLKDTSFLNLNSEDLLVSDVNKSCIGCFNCWVKTPFCCIHNDKITNIGKLILDSDELIIISKCVDGSYSSKVKRIIERSISYVEPFFTIRNKEIHHLSRLSKKLNFKIYFYGDKDTLGHAMGKQFRASLAILDEGFAKGILKELKSRT